MTVFSEMATAGHEQTVFYSDPECGLRAIVAIHSTLLGPALGGTRWYPYAGEEQALRDVLRLSAAMTAKAALAGLDLGGGKAVVIGDPAGKTPAQLRAYARLVDGLAGRYITTTDVGTTTEEMGVLRRHTPHVVGLPVEQGGGGDTSELTAVTILNGMRAALRHAFGDESVAGRRVTVLGVGKVGARVARGLAAQGARLAVADVRAEVAEAVARETGARVLALEDALTSECDVLSPNALGGILTPQTIPTLRCRVVCGGANNQLGDDPADATLLRQRGIVYAPDYVVNAGGLINVAVEHEGYDPRRARALATGVYDTTLSILEEAERLGISTAEAATRRVARRLERARAARSDDGAGAEGAGAEPRGRRAQGVSG